MTRPMLDGSSFSVVQQAPEVCAMADVAAVPPGFRSGYPPFTMGGPSSFFIFQVVLADGTTADAVLDWERDTGENDPRRVWRRPYEHQQELFGVVGWRDTISCEDVRPVMDQFIAKPYGVVAPTEWGIAQQRHVRAAKDYAEVTCTECAARFIVRWMERYGAFPEGWEQYL
jgi:hypothetical protein